MTSPASLPDSAETRAPVLIGVVVMLLLLSTLMVGLRLTSRRLVRQFTLDDVFAIASWMCIAACGGAIISMTRYGLGRHQTTVSIEDLILYLRAFWISVLTYSMALVFIKLTFLLHYLRLLCVSGMRSTCIGAIVIVVLWGLSQLIGMLLQCIPLKAAWDVRVEGKCIPNVLAWWYFNGIFNLVSDIGVIILPLPDLWRLRLPRGQKVYLMGVFGLGFFTVVVSIVRLQWLIAPPDMTWWNVTPALWSVAEITSAISCACLPFMKPLVLRLKSFFPHHSTLDSNAHLEEESSGLDEGSDPVISGLEDDLVPSKRTDSGHAQ